MYKKRLQNVPVNQENSGNLLFDYNVKPLSSLIGRSLVVYMPVRDNT